ncbi:uncharacterized protein LOC123551431 isoform X1 [Mercenaria mercenaria]|uniref:uncharacterized protein LOC123551431 isoform X1 n=1 Tax=Mercenaria mercenaria TaxID=6596 RepID=UPI001E1D2571|nr:uncharacterized protein LOC123551431 isoform X1 [Mercenaria mercenaria]XP_045196301.1 uncharacterized protein LOC123551431 isoform X1 [Mercenaria mercenaria]XP_053396890.1 uncharacterized protein LOC123551431 isoform X1 [Mercenaria mercenaria]
MDVKTIKLGTREVEFPSDKLQPLEACNHLLGDRDALWKELNEKGYLYVKGLHDRNEVLEARRSVLQYILSEGDGKLDLKKNWEEGVLDLRCGGGCLPYMEGRNDITHSEAVSKILEGPRPFAFFKTLFGETVRTFDYKWLRAVHRQAFTGAHVDNVYMSRGTPNLLTMWTPFGDCDPTIGCLAVSEGSNRLPGFDKLHSTYSQVDVEDINLNGSGWFTTDPFDITYQFGGQWKTTKYEAGDVLIFGMNTVHMSTANLTDLVRISCDTRWQPASEPADPRYVGDFKPTAKFGLYASVGSKPRTVTMEELKAKWGFQ